ncbi:DUF4417 domain-containing protein [Caproicibacterium sp. NSD3]
MLRWHLFCKLYNTFRNRWCGAYFASKGIRVIPTVSWENEKGSTVAVSTYMVSEHDNRQDQKEFFLKGYNEMLRLIEPEKIICGEEPLPVGSNLIIKSGSVVNENHQNYNSLVQTGMGSAYGRKGNRTQTSRAI